MHFFTIQEVNKMAGGNRALLFFWMYELVMGIALSYACYRNDVKQVGINMDYYPEGYVKPSYFSQRIFHLSSKEVPRYVYMTFCFNYIHVIIFCLNIVNIVFLQSRLMYGLMILVQWNILNFEFFIGIIEHAKYLQRRRRTCSVWLKRIISINHILLYGMIVFVTSFIMLSHGKRVYECTIIFVFAVIDYIIQYFLLTIFDIVPDIVVEKKQLALRQGLKQTFERNVVNNNFVLDIHSGACIDGKIKIYHKQNNKLLNTLVILDYSQYGLPGTKDEMEITIESILRNDVELGENIKIVVAMDKCSIIESLLFIRFAFKHTNENTCLALLVLQKGKMYFCHSKRKQRLSTKIDAEQQFNMLRKDIW